MCDNRFACGFRHQNKVGVFEIEDGTMGWDYSFEGKSDVSQVNCLKLGSGLKMLAAGHEDNFIRFYDPSSSTYLSDSDKKIKEMAAHSDSVTGVQFRNHFQLISCGQDGNVRVWDLRKYKCTTDSAVHVKKYDEGALCLGLSSEGMLAVGGADGLLKLFAQGE